MITVASFRLPTLSWNRRFGLPPAASPFQAILHSMTPAATSEARTIAGFASPSSLINPLERLAISPDRRRFQRFPNSPRATLRWSSSDRTGEQIRRILPPAATNALQARPSQQEHGAREESHRPIVFHGARTAGR